MALSVYFLPVGIQRKRLEIMKKSAKKIGLESVEHYNPNINFIVSELENEDAAIEAVRLKTKVLVINHEIVSSKWFFDSLKAGHVLSSALYRLQTIGDITREEKNERKLYLCCQPTLLEHKNKRFVSALEKLAQAAELTLGDLESSRALAFRKAAGTLKQLPYELCNRDQLEQLHCVGKHSKTIIQEILDESICQEITQLESSEWFASVKLFCNIYGVGPATANAWYNTGLRTLKDVKHNSLLKLDQRMIFGLSFYEDLSTPVTKSEAEIIFNIVSSETLSILPRTLLYLVGGFCRGKATGHDVDILILPPQQDKNSWLLERLCHELKSKNLLLHEVTSYRKTLNTKTSTMDNFDKSFTIFKLPNGSHVKKEQLKTFLNDENQSLASLTQLAESKRNWHARRLDLIICPLAELPFALLGWTGSKLFHRSLRDYAKRELNLSLTSHSLYDRTSNTSISVSSEAEIFAKLKVPYLQPMERNL